MRVKEIFFWKPRSVVILILFINQIFKAREIPFIFVFKTRHEIKILPFFVNVFNMLLEILSFLFNKPLSKPANETNSFHVFFSFVQFISQFSKSINDDTRNEIQENHFDYEKEGYVNEKSSPKAICIWIRLQVKRIRDSSSQSQAEVYGIQKTSNKVLTNVCFEVAWNLPREISHHQKGVKKNHYDCNEQSNQKLSPVSNNGHHDVVQGQRQVGN